MPSNRASVIGSERGVALIVAIFACVILFALAMLVINLSTSDLQVSTRTVSDKKAFVAAEGGLHRLIQNFNPDSLTSSGGWQQLDSTADPTTEYRFTSPGAPSSGPSYLPLAGYSIGGGQSWGKKRYVATVEGRSARHTVETPQVSVSVGLGYGPIEISTMSR